MTKILWLICGNGFGHLYRSYEIANNILRKNPTSIKIQFLFFSNNLPNQAKKLIDQIILINPDRWMDDLRINCITSDFNVVVSDNYLFPLTDQIIKKIPIKIVIGSFLWSRINDNINQFSKLDTFEMESLFIDKNYHLISNKYFYSHALLPNTMNLKLHGITKFKTFPDEINSDNIREIYESFFVSFGKSRYGMNSLKKFLDLINDDLFNNFKFILDLNSDEIIDNQIQIPKFVKIRSFSHDTYIKYSKNFIVRPGLGIINKILSKKGEINIFPVSMCNNKEININIRSLSKIGYNRGTITKELTITDLYDILLSSEKSSIPKRRKKLNLNGIDEASFYILDLIKASV